MPAGSRPPGAGRQVGSTADERDEAHEARGERGGAARSAQTRVFLPFDDDPVLSVVLSKALLLANDKKIEDETILRQIRGA